jgi:transcriptional regulator with XRE-family HTH domain
MPWISKQGALRRWRERACLTVPELAKRAKVSVRTIYTIEADEPHVCHLDTLNRLADALKKTGCAVVELAVQADEATQQTEKSVIDDTSAPELGTLSRRAQRERKLGLHRQALQSADGTFELMGLDRFKKCLSRPQAYANQVFAVHGTIDDYMGIPLAARRQLHCADGGRFRIVRNVAADLVFYTTIFATTAELANHLDQAVEGPPVSVLVRVVYLPADGEWKGLLWFERTPKPREFAFVVDRVLPAGKVMKELP